MKKYGKKALSLILAMLMIISVLPLTATSSFAETSGDWEYSVLNNEATITGYKGKGTDVTIPSKLDGYSVTSIGYKAFYYQKLTSITIPDSVTSIGSEAFRGCNSLTSITIPDSVTSIGEKVFSFCSSLTSITIPDRVIRIGTEAFHFCSSLTSVTIPDSVTIIGESAFEYCVSLTSINIPDSVIRIENKAFHDTFFTSITVDSNNLYYSSVDGVLFNKDKTNLIRYPAGKKNDSYLIPDCVTSIGSFAFDGCNSLTSIKIPDSVTKINSSAFSGCTSLTSLTIGNSVTSIGEFAFTSCTSLKSITIPDSVTNINSSAFVWSTSLKSINVNGNNKSYYSVNGVLFNKDLSELILYPEGKTDKQYSIPNCVTSLGEYAFRYCVSLTSINIPDSVTRIDWGAFCNCTSLTSITIPNSVTTISNAAFSDCTSLTSITIPNSVKSISDSAFFNCTSLTIYGYSGSYAETYAKNNNIPFFDLSKSTITFTHISSNYLNINVYDYRKFAEGSVLGNGDNANLGIKSVTGKLGNLNLSFDTSTSLSKQNKNNSLTLSASGYRKTFVPATVLSTLFDDPDVVSKNFYLMPEKGDGKPYITGVYARKSSSEKAFTDLISDKLTANKDTRYDMVVCADGNGSEISEIYISQDSNHKIPCTGGVVFASVLSEKLEAGKPVYAYVKTKNGKTSEPLKLKLDITNMKDLGGQLNLGGKDGLKYTVSDDIPLVGGAELSVDGFKFPIGVEVEGNRFKISLGTNIFSGKSDYHNGEHTDCKWEKFKNQIGGLSKSVNDSTNKLSEYKKIKDKFGKDEILADVSTSKNWDLSFLGYIEGYMLSDGKMVVTDSSASVTGEFKFKYTYQGAVYVVPVYAYVEAGGAFNVVFRATRSLPDGDVPFEFSLTVGLTPKAKIGGGVGVKGAASAGIYGKASLPVQADFLNSHLTASITGELGVEAELFCFGGELKILEGSLNFVDWYWNAGKKNVQQNSFGELYSLMPNNAQKKIFVTKPVARDYAVKTSAFNNTKGIDITSSGLELSELQTNVFKNSLPQIVRLNNGTLVAVYVTDDPGRNSANRMKLVCSVYRNGAWSTPFAVSDDGTNDSAPSLATDGTNVYVAWQNIKTQLAENDSNAFANIFKNSEICLAKLNSSLNGFTGVKTITSDSSYDYMPKISVVSDAVTLYWVKNSANNLVSGKNTIYKYSSSNSSTSTLASNLNYIFMLDCASSNVAYSQDVDGDLSTTEDVAVYVIESGKSKKVSPDEGGAYMYLDYGKLDSKDVLFFADQSNICTYTGGKTETVAEVHDCISGDLSAVSLSDGTALIFTSATEQGTELQYVSYENGSWNEAVKISDEKALINNVSAVSDGNAVYLLLNRTARTLQNEEYVSGQTDLCFGVLNDYTDISAELLTVDEFTFNKGENASLQVNIKNNGTQAVSKVDVTVTDSFGTSTVKTYDINLNPGEEDYIDVDYKVPDSFAKGKIDIKALPNNATDINPDDNSSSRAVGLPDLSFGEAFVDEVGEYYVINTVVNNLTCINADNAYVSAFMNDENGQLLQKAAVEAFEDNQSKTIEYILPKEKLEEGANTICLKVETSGEEAADNNNYKYVVIEKPADENADCSVVGHDWGEAAYTWSSDNSKVTAKRVCKTDSSHFETETVNTTSEITVQPTTTSTGKMVYTAEFKNEGFKKQTKTVTLDKLPDNTKEFPDVKKGSWYYDAVQYCAQKGYISGYANGNFGPNDNLKRQDFVVILSKIAGADLDKYAKMTPKLKDVKKGAYYAAAVNWAVDNNIIAGYANGNFGVNDNITREQVATILYRYMKSPEVKNVDSTLKKFSDVNRISSFAKTAVAWAVQNNVISGMADGRVAPTEGAARAQIASIIMRMDQQGMFNKA